MLWSSFVTNADLTARYSASVVACLGLVALLLVTLAWRWARKYYRELVAKVVVAGFRAAAGASALQSRSGPAAGGDWIDQPGSVTLMASIAGYLFWEVAGYIGDDRFKRAQAKTLAEHEEEIADLSQSRDDAALEATRSEWLLAFLREPVGHALQRIRRIVSQNVGPRVSIQHVREGLDSEGQVRTILESLAGLFRLDAVSAGGSIQQNFRVGLYVEEGGRLVPRDAFDLGTKSHSPFASPQTQPERFRLDHGDGPSHAVRCVTQGKTLIVADCVAASEFVYFGDIQRNYLRSMVAYPLDDCRPDGV